ncbi:MAG TPA: hypothetical protein VK558_09010 [Patescibacteria group bacterium]|nr:hypothetical protein [Patescibacteria group bacterium]
MTEHGRMDPATRRRIRYRLLQVGMLLLMGIAFFIAALAQPVFNSAFIGWVALACLLIAVGGFWWAGRQAERRGGPIVFHDHFPMD